MRNPSARLFLITTLGVSLIVVAGCGQAADRDASREGDTQSVEPLLGLTCPSSGKIEKQKRVTAFVDYVLGSPTDPFAAYPCTVGGAEAVALLLRPLVAAGLVTIEDPTQSTVCGLPAAPRVLKVAGLSAADGATLTLLGPTMDLCWGDGTSAFFHVTPSLLGNVFSVYMDPEPAVTTQDLTGSNGASAAAVYENSGTPTSVLKWYSTYVYAPSLAAGTPCSNGDLPVGGTAIKTVLAAGNYKRCG